MCGKHGAPPLARVTSVILRNLPPKVHSMMQVEHFPATEKRHFATAFLQLHFLRMTEVTKSSPKGSDWTRLLTDPDLVSHLGKLLQTYREVAPELRERALLRAMREIKDAAVAAREAGGTLPVTASPTPRAVLHAPVPVKETPPFELDLAPQLESHRRRFHRIKCYVAV